MESVGVLTGIGVKVGLAAVLALGATAAARYIHQARHGWRTGRGRLRVVETAALGQNRAVHLVSIGTRTLLLASTPSQIAMLADVTGEQEAAAEEAGSAGRKASHLGRDFAAVLRHLLAPRNTGVQPAAGAGDTLPTASPRTGLPYDTGTAGRPEDERGDRAERLLAAARRLRRAGARGWTV